MATIRVKLRWAKIVVLVIGLTGVVIAAPRKPKDTIKVVTPLSSLSVVSQESNLGDVVADAVRETGQSDFAFVAASELREVGISAGDVPVAQIVQALRFADDESDQIVVLRVNGDQIQRAAERSLSRTPLPFDGFFQISGLRFRCDPAQGGGRSITVSGASGKTISPTDTYTVATTRAIADGSMGYYQVWKRSDISQETSVSVTDSLRKYLTGRTELDSNLEDRISINL